MTTPVDGAKARAKLLSQRLAQLGVSIRHTQALEALAASEGFSDWNRYQAHLQHHPRSSSRQEEASLTFLGLRPGTGKTTAAVRHCQSRRDAGPILWINLVDQNGPALATQPGDRAAVLAYDSEGKLSPVPRLEHPGVTMLSLTAGPGTPMYSPAGDQALEQAFDHLMAHLEQAFEAGWRPATVILDEAHRLKALGSAFHASQKLGPLMAKNPGQWIVLGQSDPLEWVSRNKASYRPFTEAPAGIVRDWGERGGQLWVRETGVPDLPVLRGSLVENFERLALNRPTLP